ncbi:oxidoreductase domain protein [Oceanithermus profundus DSM 14977]|uniref:Oxidoreductase domain protein n=1 Tax=Oceanithermus profundus (strain DSM 14977 / NBRC 100410 / VKM B-2274 / 506) TaxID=670487 RepID=E4U791_OCEP5|nr:Gfo/Idh/MocA family oxidoreductase [Oceanithermus profundus]ADR36220.1 oxidoreductase domain protein [Oceanithermus profundus DSM 14977]
MKIGIVGVGTMGRVHADAYRRIGAELVGAYDPNPEKLAEFVSRFTVDPFRSYDELLLRVDLVDVTAPTFAHEELTVRALEAGKDVILEKPLALDAASGRRILEAARKSGRRLFVAMVVRFFPQYRRAAELAKSGQLGRVGVVRLKRVLFPPGPGWYRDPEKSGGMPVDLMIHDLDYVRWLLGDPVRVFARRSPPVEGEVLEHVQAVLGYADGRMAIVEGGWAYPAGYFRTALDLAGDRGLVEWSSDQSPPLGTLFPADEPAPEVGLPMAGLEEDPYELELRHALEALGRGKPFDVTPEDALAALELALAVRASADSGRVVEVA